MDEMKIVDSLKNRTLTIKDIYSSCYAQNIAEQNEIDKILKSLIEEGVVYKDKKNHYSLLDDKKMILAKVTSKYKNFVLLSTIPNNKEIKISGDEADSYLIGDVLYLVSYKYGYHAVDYLKTVTSLKGSFSLNRTGKEILQVPALSNCGKSVYITDKSNLEPVQGDFLLCDIISMNKSMIQVKISKILVKSDEVGGDISRIIIANNAPIEFSDSTLEEIKNISDSVSSKEKEGRVDFTSHLVVTIDGNDAHDFDDAVEIERYLNGYKVVVHIADVTHYLKPNTSLDEDAFERGTSIYVADRVIPMLPFSLSNGICSLNPNVERLTLSCTMLIDSQGKVFDSKIERGIIKSSARLTYEKVNELYNGNDVELTKKVKDMLLLLKECSTLVRQRRKLNGCMDLSSSELKFHLDENGMPIDVIKETQGEAEKVIEDFMILANCSVARLLKDEGIPVLYRIHENPPSDKVIIFKDFLRKVEPRLLSVFPSNDNITPSSLMEFISKIEDKKIKYAINAMLLRTMAKAKYSPDEVGHFGLAEDYYCHFTSPIRRYPDDIIHRLVKRYLLDKNNCPYDEIHNELERDGKYLTTCEIKADVIERQVDDLESCKYLSNKIGLTLHGRISTLLPRGMFIETDLGIEGFMMYHCMHGDVFKYNERRNRVEGKHHENLTFSLGDEIDVTVINADTYSLNIDFSTPEFYEKYLKELPVERIQQIIIDGIHVDKVEEVKPIYLHSYNKIQEINEETKFKTVVNAAGFTREVEIKEKKKERIVSKDKDFNRSSKDKKPFRKDDRKKSSFSKDFKDRGNRGRKDKFKNNRTSFSNSNKNFSRRGKR